MTTAIFPPSTLSTPSTASQDHSPLLRQLGRRLAAMLGNARARARPLAPAASAGALDKNCTFWVEQPLELEISCTRGTLWLTFDGVPKDIVLQAGQSYRCDSASRLAIHAIDAARFEIA